KKFYELLSDFSAISVREKNAEVILKTSVGLNATTVLDPTLLLKKEEWDSILDQERVTEEKFIFCYFLEPSTLKMQLVKEYAKEKALSIYTIPFLNGFNTTDIGHRIKWINDESPLSFIKLIRDAQIIFTDSFHATVFSEIYHKEFFVLPRSKQKGMSSRVSNLLSVFGHSARFCDTDEKCNYGYISSLELPENQEADLKLLDMRRNSVEFLKVALSEEGFT
ncbi:polysaccharide pyruvyl transferase family protein, partial [Ruminococcus sp.]|uniref:polysaccharide pyruvyl transferase family protein n=1 Tax=Ruminococcus sp. TaxID=41978 RepID=UPI0025E90F62